MASELRRAIEEFLYSEAELLDERKLREWLDLLSDDVRYWMPIRHNPLDRPAEVSEELSKAGDGYYFNDDKQSLKIRGARLRQERLGRDAALAHAPPDHEHPRQKRRRP